MAPTSDAPTPVAMPMMTPHARLTGRSRRSQSISSDKTSVTGNGNLFAPLTSISPEPAFIALSAASQIITNDHETQLESWLEQFGLEPSNETATLVPGSLSLVNSFLDQLLFQFLSIARSTSLASLRTSVTEVLKPKLAKDAIYGADQELNEYLGGGEEEELATFHQGQDTPRDWDLELVWKRTRLRCMVYSSLGDMEEEDEDYYAEQLEEDGVGRFSTDIGVVSPAVAIFLTSILEFVGEQVLLVAGQAAYHRQRAKQQKEEQEGRRKPTGSTEPIVVEDTDVEKVAMDRTLGRLWRTWRKRLRTPTASVSVLRTLSLSGSPVAQPTSEAAEQLPSEEQTAAAIPLPQSDDDVREIEIPGIAAVVSDDEDDDEEEPARRPISMFVEIVSPRSAGDDQSVSRQRSTSDPGSWALQRSVETAEAESTEPEAMESIEESIEELVEELVEEPVEEPVEETVEGPVEEPVREQVEKPGEKVEEPTEVAHNTEKAQVEQLEIAGPENPELHEAEHSEDDDEDLPIQSNVSKAVESASPPVLDNASKVDMATEVVAGTPAAAAVVAVEETALNGRTLPPKSSQRPTPLERPARPTVRTAFDRPKPGLDSHAPFPDRVADETQSVRSLRRDNSSSSVTTINSGYVSAKQELNSASSSVSDLQDTRATIRDVRGIPDETLAHAQLQAQPTPRSAESSPRFVEPSKPATYIPTKQFVLGAAPPSRAAYGSPNYVPPPRPTIQLRSASYMSGENGPPLTPLREMTEGGLEGVEPSLPPSRSANDMIEATPRSSLSQQRQRSDTGKSDKGRTSHVSTPSASSFKRKPMRTSEDGAPTPIEDKAKSFEELIQSDQTIQYTLTPQSMRDMELPSPSSIRPPPLPILKEDRPRTSGSYVSVSKLPAAKDVSQPVPAKRTPVQARDARVNGDSMGDFADFIRSTGPSGYDKPAARASPVSIQRIMANNNRLPSEPPSPASSGTVTLNGRGSSSTTRSRLQARGAAGPPRSDTMDLAEFIRQGPPDGADRSVSVRAIMDPMPDAGHRASPDSTVYSNSTGQPKSLSNSSPRTNSANGANGLHRPVTASGTMGFEEPPMPVRKSRRVRDPYAIEYSDEEEELEAWEAMKRNAAPRRKEESLIEFLNSVPPPPPVPPTPLIDPLSEQYKALKKKSSAPSLMARFVRKESKDTAQTSPRSSTPKSSMRKHVPISATIPLHDAVQPSVVAANDYNRSANMMHKNFVARDASARPRTATTDLADFIRQTEPPMPLRPASKASKEKPFRGFGMGKKSTAY